MIFCALLKGKRSGEGEAELMQLPGVWLSDNSLLGLSCRLWHCPGSPQHCTHLPQCQDAPWVSITLSLCSGLEAALQLFSTVCQWEYFSSGFIASRTALHCPFLLTWLQGTRMGCTSLPRTAKVTFNLSLCLNSKERK